MNVAYITQQSNLIYPKHVLVQHHLVAWSSDTDNINDTRIKKKKRDLSKSKFSILRLRWYPATDWLHSCRVKRVICATNKREWREGGCSSSCIHGCWICSVAIHQVGFPNPLYNFEVSWRILLPYISISLLNLSSTYDNHQTHPVSIAAT